MTEEYNKNTVAELKVLLKEQGLPVSGNKKDLIARLEKASEDPFSDDDLAKEAEEAEEAEEVEQSQEDEELEDDFDDYDDEEETEETEEEE